MPTAERLLQQIDRLPHPTRLRVIADTARSLAGTAELRPLLDGLGRHDNYGRCLALQLATIAGDHDYVEHCLDSPDQEVRARAVSAAVKLGLPVSLLVERLPRMPAAHRAGLYRALRGAPNVTAAEALLPVAQEHFGDHEAAGLLAAASHERAAALLPDLDHAVANWAVLGRRHPEQLLSYVEQRLAAEPGVLWPATWSQVGPAVAAATESDPARVLDLLERTVPHAPFPAALIPRIGTLARFDPTRFLHLITDPRRRGQLGIGRKVMKALAVATDDELIDLGRALDEPGRLADLLHALPPSRRPVVHRGVAGSRDPGPLGLGRALEAVDELPASARHEEARRLLTLLSVLDDPDARLEVTSRLDWATAQPILAEAARRPDANERARAYTLLAQAAAGSRQQAVLGEFVHSLDRFRNDQDVVKCAVLSALTPVPSWLFSDADAAAVSGLFADALQARDCSWATRSAIRSLCDRLLREGAINAKPQLVRTALDGMQLLASHGASVELHHLDRDLPSGAERGVVTALLPRIEADAARGEYDVALALARGLGRRAWDLEELQSYVDRARSATSDSVVREAISLWLAPPTTRDERVAVALRADRSTITLPVVANAVGWRRTDLLDDVLRRSMHGRFLKRGVRFAPDFHGCFDRWMPRQVAAYSGLLETIATSARLPTWERASATRSLARLAGNIELVRTLTSDPEVSVSEAAIAGLAWTDDPASVLPELIALAQTDRARVAVPAITRAARFVAPGDLAETLRPLLIGPKITSRKEGARLLAEHRVPGAAQLLLDAWQAPEQHRDVRRAVAAAARFHLDDAAIWDLLDRAAATPDIATALLDLPVTTVARRHRPAYAALVHRVATADDPDTARLGLTALPMWLPWRPDAVEMLANAVGDLSRSAVWRAGLAALVAGCALTGSAKPLVRLAGSLSAADDDALDGVNRDRPARQRLASLIQATRSAAIDADQRPLSTAVGEALAEQHPEGAVLLLAAGLDFADTTPIVRLCDLADRPLVAMRASNAVEEAFGRVVRRLPPGRADRLLGDLEPYDSLARGLVAVAIAKTAGAAAGWPEDMQARVRALREHADLDVRTAALEVVMAPE